MAFTLRDLVYVGVFGAMWGAIEATLGAALHVLHVPFTGLILASAGITLALIGRLFVPRPGALVAIGVVTALLKAFSVGGLILNPMIAIVAESALAELTLLVLPARRASFVAAGAMALLWPVVHPLVLQTLLAGRGILEVYVEVAGAVRRQLGVGPAPLVWGLVALAALHMAAGSVAGWLAWDAGNTAARRLGHDEENT
jgi:hypothetical protein